MLKGGKYFLFIHLRIYTEMDLLPIPTLEKDKITKQNNKIAIFCHKCSIRLLNLTGSHGTMKIQLKFSTMNWKVYNRREEF